MVARLTDFAFGKYSMSDERMFDGWTTAELTVSGIGHVPEFRLLHCRPAYDPGMNTKTDSTTRRRSTAGGK